MTGEMHTIDADGNDSNGESWPVHAAVARALGCELRAFDKYLGPYIAHPAGRLWLGDDTGANPYVCLWPGGDPPAYRRPRTRRCRGYSAAAAISAARAVLRDVRRRVPPC